MKSFDPNLTNYFSKKTIKLTFQQWDYKGTAYVEIGGNTTFTDLLSEFEDADTLAELLKESTSKLDFELKYLGEGEFKKKWYQANLVNDKGEVCECEDWIETLPEMLVAIELVDVQREDK